MGFNNTAKLALDIHPLLFFKIGGPHSKNKYLRVIHQIENLPELVSIICYIVASSNAKNLRSVEV